MKAGPFASPIACGLALNSICNEAAIVVVAAVAVVVVVVVAAKVQSGKIAAILPTTPAYCYYSDLWLLLLVAVSGYYFTTISVVTASWLCVSTAIESTGIEAKPQLKCRLGGGAAAAAAKSFSVYDRDGDPHRIQLLSKWWGVGSCRSCCWWGRWFHRQRSTTMNRLLLAFFGGKGMGHCNVCHGNRGAAKEGESPSSAQQEATQAHTDGQRQYR